ncbi:uncharacterized protein LOC126213122 [Schistocerca nitens]|uniref:uncharacterized protein LOC126213122 n=1 Tax=Schistocerca nitens TaxID=7011 RepID=UPI0021187E31|nr:uncharacterized protein LOC126213122 [Schistocerca nitens]
MDQDPTMWIKKEETDEVKTELRSMANKIFQYSVLTTRGNICPVRARHLENGCKQGSGLPIQHEEGVNKEFLEDPLKTEGPSVSVKQDPELKQHADGSEHNSVKDPFGISWSTDFIKEDPELNLEINVTEDIAGEQS